MQHASGERLGADPDGQRLGDRRGDHPGARRPDGRALCRRGGGDAGPVRPGAGPLRDRPPLPAAAAVAGGCRQRTARSACAWRWWTPGTSRPSTRCSARRAAASSRCWRARARCWPPWSAPTGTRRARPTSAVLSDSLDAGRAWTRRDARRARRGRGRRRDAAPERPGPRHPVRQHAVLRRHPAAGVGHPHRAAQAGLPDPLPH